MTKIEKLKSLVAGLNDLIAFLEKNEGLADRLYIHGYRQSVSCHDKKEFGQVIRQVSKGVGKLAKSYTDYSCSVERKFGEFVSISCSVNRESVCEKVVTGSRVVPSFYVPEHTEEVIEWKCK